MITPRWILKMGLYLVIFSLVWVIVFQAIGWKEEEFWSTLIWFSGFTLTALIVDKFLFKKLFGEEIP